MTINQLLQKLEPTSPILQANFGIERESLRVDRQTKAALSLHDTIDFLAIYDEVINFLEQASDGSIAVNKVVLHTELFDFICYFASFLRILTLLFSAIKGGAFDAETF